MARELSKNLKVVVIRGGLQVWVEAEKIEKLTYILTRLEGKSKFIEYEGQIINTADITGIFDPQTIEANSRRKNGQWQCLEGNWHERGEKCKCSKKEVTERNRKWQEAVAVCGKCQNGWIVKDGLVAKCDCVKNIDII